MGYGVELGYGGGVGFRGGGVGGRREVGPPNGGIQKGHKRQVL